MDDIELFMGGALMGAAIGGTAAGFVHPLLVIPGAWAGAVTLFIPCALLLALLGDTFGPICERYHNSKVNEKFLKEAEKAGFDTSKVER